MHMWESILKCHWSGSKDLLYIPAYKAIRICQTPDFEAEKTSNIKDPCISQSPLCHTQWLKWEGQGGSAPPAVVLALPCYNFNLGCQKLGMAYIAWEPLFYLSFVIKISSQ